MAFECRIKKTCYFCERRNHHHRSLCEYTFGTFKNGNAQIKNYTENTKQRIRNGGQELEGKLQEPKLTESTPKLSSCKLQVMDSEDDVYVPQTNMEVEFALTA